ncbi:hypothetical protein SCA6_006527 [Theobroma cacao]
MDYDRFSRCELIEYHSGGFSIHSAILAYLQNPQVTFIGYKKCHTSFIGAQMPSTEAFESKLSRNAHCV